MKSRKIILICFLIAFILIVGFGIKSLTWKNYAIDISTYGYVNNFSIVNHYLRDSGRISPHITCNTAGHYCLINDTIYEIKEDELIKLCELPSKKSEMIGATEQYIYCIEDISSGYTVYRYSFETKEVVQAFSALEEQNIYGFGTIGKYAWINGNDCLLTTLKEDYKDYKRSYTALYIFSDSGEYERYTITDSTKELTDEYECQKIDDILFITNKDNTWFVECDGDDVGVNTIVGNGCVYESGTVEVDKKYSSKWMIGSYTWYIYPYEDKVIYHKVGARKNGRDYFKMVNGSTSSWYYDSIDILDTNTGEIDTLYIDSKNRVIGYNPITDEVYLYSYSKNAIMSKCLGNKKTKLLFTFPQKDNLIFEWEGTNLFYFYGLGENMQYGGMIDVSK